MFLQSVNVWFVCKTCRGSFQKLDCFIEHKKQQHLEEFQETECIVFEESSISIQNNDEYRNFTSAKEATTAEAQMPSHSTNFSGESRSFDEFPPVIVKIETLFEPNNDDMPSPSVEYPFDSIHQDFPQSPNPPNYQIYSHPSFTTNDHHFDLTTTAAVEATKAESSTKPTSIVKHNTASRKSVVEQQQQQQKQHPPLNAFVLAKKLTVNEIQKNATLNNASNNSFNKALSGDSTKSTNFQAQQKLIMNRSSSMQNKMHFPIQLRVLAPAPAPAHAPAPTNIQNKIAQFQCKLCSKKWNSLTELHSHQASCILTSRFQDRFCVLCNRVFCNSIYLKSHILRIHPTEEEKARRRQLISELSPNAVVLRNSPQKRPAEPESKPLKCSMCDMSFYCNSLLTLHLKTHYKEERAFKCSEPNCGKSYNLKKHLKQHLSTHFDAHLLSKLSKIKSFGSVSNKRRISTGIATATATATNQASVLPYAAGSSSVPSIGHPSDDDPFAGQQSTQGQPDPLNQILTDAPTTHLNSEPEPAPAQFEFDLDGDYKCRLCLHKCDTGQDLKTHVATCALNHESRHCYCVTCNKKFPNSKILRVHTFRYHGYGHGHALNAAPPEERKRSRPPKQPLPPRSYKCQICSKKYMYKLPFQSHMKSHYASKTNDSKTFKCHFCPKSFNYPSLLKYHLRTHPESEVNVASFAAVVENLMTLKKTAAKNSEKEKPKSENRAVLPQPQPQQHSLVVRSKIKNKANNTNCGNFVCTYMDCDQTFKYRKPFRKHILSHTGRIGTETIPGPGPGHPVRTSPGTGTGTSVRTGTGIGEGTYQSSTNSGSVSDHLYSGKAFQRNLRFTNHLKTHAEDVRRYRCPLPKCDKGFKFKTGIKRHLLFHADLRSFKCPHLNCEQTFEL